MTDLAVSCKGLRKHYGAVTAVDGLDLAIQRGECFGLLGPNGAGKTTTIEILQGLLRPDAGEVTVLGLDWQHHERALRLRLGTQLQETQFPDKLKVTEILRLFGSFYSSGFSLQETLDFVGLKEKGEAWVKDLSGGQRQRLAVATALVGDPDLVFLDEPTTGLDPQSRLQLWDVIRAFQERGKTVVLTTHYMEEAERLCDRVGIVDHGKMIALGTPPELVASLGANHVVEFALQDGQNILDAVLEGLPGVHSVRREDQGVRLTVTRLHETVPALMVAIDDSGAELSELLTHHATLEDVFIALTGRHLRDG